MKNANESWSSARVFFLRSFSSTSPAPLSLPPLTSPLFRSSPSSFFPSSHGEGAVGGEGREGIYGAK